MESYKDWTLVSVDETCMETLPCRHVVNIRSPDKTQLVTVTMSAPDIKALRKGRRVSVPSCIIGEEDDNYDTRSPLAKNIGDHCIIV